MVILGDTVDLTRAEMNEYFQMTLYKEWNVGLNDNFEKVYNSGMFGFLAQGTANYTIYWDGVEDIEVALPQRYGSTLIVEDDLNDLNSTKITVTDFFKFGSTSTSNGVYGNAVSEFNCDRVGSNNAVTTNLEINSKMILGGLEVWIDGTLNIRDSLKTYQCFLYDTPSPIYSNHIKLTSGSTVKYIPLSSDVDFEDFRTPLKIGGMYVLAKMQYKNSVPPVITQKGYGKMILTSEVGANITFNGQTKASGSTWKNLTQNTIIDNAVSFFPSSDGVGQGDNSEPLLIKMLGYPTNPTKGHWDKLSFYNANTLTSILKAFRIDNNSNWEYYTSNFTFSAKTYKTILESHNYKDVFSSILQETYSHRWAFSSSDTNVISSAIVGWRADTLVEKITAWEYTDYTDRPWTYVIETS